MWAKKSVGALVAVCLLACGSTVETVSGTPGAGGDGGAGGQEPPLPNPKPPAVACESAVEGDACANVGASCQQGYDCSTETTICGDDYRWHVSGYEEPCCYDDCCEGDCGCYPGCPAYEPELGNACDPCFDGPSCLYEGSLPECASANVEVVCDPATLLWTEAGTTCP